MIAGWEWNEKEIFYHNRCERTRQVLSWLLAIGAEQKSLFCSILMKNVIVAALYYILMDCLAGLFNASELWVPGQHTDDV